MWEVWTDENIRGWGRPVLAINAAKVGNPERAIYHLTNYGYWKFDDAGTNFHLLTRSKTLLTLPRLRVCSSIRSLYAYAIMSLTATSYLTHFRSFATALLSGSC